MSKMICSICKKPAPWLFKAQVPFCSKHYHQRKSGWLFVVEVKEGTDESTFINRPNFKDRTGRWATVPEKDMARQLDSPSLLEAGVLYIFEQHFESAIYGIYHDQPKMEEFT